MRVLLVDDHALIREGLRLLLEDLEQNIELDQAGNCEEALALAAEHAYDLVLLDLKMPGVEGLDALTIFRERHPEFPVVILSGEGTPRLVREAIEAGCMGFVSKSSSHQVFEQALKLVLAGGVYLPPDVLRSGGPESGHDHDSRSEAISGLSPRQVQVLRCIIQGKSNKIIARELDVSEHTVKAHLSAVFRALGVHSRTEAVFAAAKSGISLS